MAQDQNLDGWKKEFAQIQKLRKKSRFNFKNTNRIINRVLPGYKKVMEHHLGKYREHFTEYWTRHDKDVIVFDIEEYHNEIVCIMTLKISNDSRYLIHINLFEGWPKDHESKKIYDAFKDWLENQEPSIVIIHGTNQNELNLLKESVHELVNTQELLAKPEIQRELGNDRTGLDAFEDSIGFKREGCKFLKHNKNLPNSMGWPFINYFFNLSLLSIHYHLKKKKQRKCWKCGKLQDVLLYCLEDSFTTLLAYVMCDSILAK